MNKLDNGFEKSEEKRASEFEQFLKFIGIVWFFPVALAHFQALNLSTRAFVWRIKEFHSDILISLVLLFPTSFFCLWIAINRLIQHNIKLFCVYLIIYWICLLPLALAVLSFRLTMIVDDIAEHKFPIKYLSSTVFAIHDNAFNKAHRLFEQMKFVLPLFAQN